jgi:hypothetical protein
MYSIRKHRRMFGLLAALMVLLQPLFAFTVQRAMAADQPDNPFGGLMVICTAKGQVVLDDQGQPQPVNHGTQCPLCQIGCCAGLTTAAAPLQAETRIYFPDPVLQDLRFNPIDAAGKPDLKSSCHSPRGPPRAAV